MTEQKKHHDLKTRIYIDASNIILAMKEIGYEVNFLSLQRYLQDRFRTQEIYYFTPNLERLHEDLKMLETSNFKIIKKEIYFYQNKMKANCDVEIAHYITKDIKDNLVERLVLLSGDADFSILLNYANQNKIVVKVLSVTKKSTAKLLRSKNFFKVEYLKNIPEILEKKDAHGNVIHRQ